MYFFFIVNGNQVFVGNGNHFPWNLSFCAKKSNILHFFYYLLSWTSSHSINHGHNWCSLICNFCLFFRKINFHVHSCSLMFYHAIVMLIFTSVLWSWDLSMLTSFLWWDLSMFYIIFVLVRSVHVFIFCSAILFSQLEIQSAIQHEEFGINIGIHSCVYSKSEPRYIFLYFGSLQWVST